MRAVLTSLALAAMSLMLSLAIVEIALRVVLPVEACRRRAPLWQPDPLLGWSLIPNTAGDAVVCHGDRELHRTRVAVNALGQRDRPRDIAGEGPRVAVLGDSFVEAVQVPLEHTFLARIEDAHGIEMLNFGVSGYSTDNQVRSWLARARHYRPDAVLLFVFVGNDVLENGARLYLKNPHGLPPKPWLRAIHASRALTACLAVHRAAARANARIPTALWTSSRLTRLIATQGVGVPLQLACQHAAGPDVTAGVPELLGVYGPPRTVAWDEGWRMTERNIARLARRVRGSGAAFGVVIVPSSFEIDPDQNPYLALYPAVRSQSWDWDYPERRLLEFLAAADVPAMSLRGPLRAQARRGRTGYYPWDGHWDDDGHAVVARAVLPFVNALLARRP